MNACIPSKFNRYIFNFCGDTVVKNLPANAGDTGNTGSIPGWRRSPGGGNSNTLPYSCLDSPMDGRTWWAVVHGVTKSWTRLSNFTFTFHFHALEKEMATHSSVLAWRIPGMGEPGGLQSMGSHRVGHNRGNLAAAAANILARKIPWTQEPGVLLSKRS